MTLLEWTAARREISLTIAARKTNHMRVCFRFGVYSWALAFIHVVVLRDRIIEILVTTRPYARDGF